MPRRLTLLLAAFFVMTPSAHAETLNVPADYATIQSAFDAATSGDTVAIACGTYFENVLTLSASIVIKGESTACTVIDCGGWEGIYYPGTGPMTIVDITLRNCTGAVDTWGALVATNVRFDGGGAEMAMIAVGGAANFTDCSILSYGSEGAPLIFGAASQFVRCSFIGCHSNNSGCIGIFDGHSTFLDCWFEDNDVEGEGSGICGGNVILQSCAFINNIFAERPGHGDHGGAVRAGTVAADLCLFYGNRGDDDDYWGSAISATQIEISRSIFVANWGPEIIECENGGSIEISCSNVWGNPESNWDGCLVGQLGQNGNISVDPAFCNPASGDFHLSSISPCLDAACGTMGFLGLGCFDEKPGIIDILDLGNDQGRQARLSWYRSQHDAFGTPFDGYAIYRRQDLYAVATQAAPLAAPGVVVIPGWDYVTTVPDRADEIYQVVVPTLCDSTITSGQCWSAFMVSALTPTAFYDSPIDSGYSKDNLAPPTPTSFAVEYNTGSGNHLSWDAVAAADFAGFRVYRGLTPGFVPSLTTLMHSTTQTAWNDPAFDGWSVYYKVTSFDLAGNESVPTGGGIVTGTGGQSPRPGLVLGGSVPNPFNPSTRIPFTIPANGRVRLTIYDVTGALVCVVVDRTMSAGSHDVTWDGKDANGQTLGSGVYLCRLEHPAGVRTSKLAILK